jgi:hypothetical protein
MQNETKRAGDVSREARAAQNEKVVLQALEKSGTLSIRSISNTFNILKSNTASSMTQSKTCTKRLYKISLLPLRL